MYPVGSVLGVMPGSTAAANVSDMSNQVDARLRAALQEMDDIMKGKSWPHQQKESVVQYSQPLL